MPRKVFLVPEPASHAFGRRLFQGMVSAAYGYPDVQLEICQNDRDWVKAIRSYGASGVVVGPWLPDHVREIVATGVCCVGLANMTATKQMMPVVSNDDDAVGTLVAEHLLAMGHRHFATFTALWARPHFHVRIRAFVRVIRQAGFTVQHGPSWPAMPRLGSGRVPEGDAWHATAADWLRSLPKPLALFAMSDYNAYVALSTCRSIGLSVPKDVAIVGVDNDDVYCAIARPQLSSVALAAYEIGQKCIEVLHDLTSGNAPKSSVTYVKPTALIVRGSSDVEAIDDPDVAKALSFIRENFSQAITVDDIVNHVLTSRRTLERRFAETLQRTISEQLRCVRVDAAKRLLVDTDLDLARIARSTGLKRQQHLNHTFKAMTGTPPGAYRARFKKP